MSFSSIQDDNRILNNFSSKNKIRFAPELSQGKTYLISKNKMIKSIRRRNKKVEGFDNMGLDDSIQLPVKLESNNEINQLISMQNSYEKTIDQWNNQYNTLVHQIDNNKSLYQQCLDSCNQHEDRDLLTACIYGCTSGKYISSGATYRGPAPPPIGLLGVMFPGSLALNGILNGLDSVANAFVNLFRNKDQGKKGPIPVPQFIIDAIKDGKDLAADMKKNKSNNNKAIGNGDKIKKAMSALSISASSMFGVSVNPQKLMDSHKWSSSLTKSQILQIMNKSFMFHNKIATGYEIFNEFKKILGITANFNDLPLKEMQNMAIFLNTLPNAPNFEEIVTPLYKGSKESKPVNTKLIYYKKQEGFTGSPEEHSFSSVSGKAENIYSNEGLFQNAQMGDYGPAGYKFKDKNKIDEFKDVVNSKLSSNPQLPGDSWLTGEGAKEDAVTSQEINDINPDGVRANINNATNAFSQILKSMPNDPLIVQMQKADIGPDNLTQTMEKLENQWKGIFESVCKAGIAKDSENTFAGRQQYCKSWTNTMEGRSGFFGDNWIVDNNGNKKDNGLIGQTFKLNNNSEIGSSSDKANSRMGCDVIIPGTRTSDSNIGGAGYCECNDGSKIYMDEGHPNITCNDMCYPDNVENKGGKNLFYHDSSLWNPTLKAIPNKTGPGAFNISPSELREGTWLKCGENGSDPDNCPSGMQQVGNVKGMGQCGTFKDENALSLGERLADDFDPFGTPYPIPTVTEKGRICVNPLPAGGEKPYVGPKEVEDNGMGAQIPVGYKKLSTPNEIVDACSKTNYPNIYVEILSLKALEIILGNKTKVMEKIIRNSNDARIKTQLKQSEAGRRLLKNLRKYNKTYNRFYRNQTKANLLDGMEEDIYNKKASANISYYLWFALAISGMLIVIKNIKK